MLKMAKKEELHKALMVWATDEMRFQTTANYSGRSTQLPSKNDFKLLLQKPLDDVWKYVLKNVNSVQTVKEAKGNLALKHGMSVQKSQRAQHRMNTEYDEEKEEAELERAQLERELASCLSDVSCLQREMNQVTREVMEAELAYQSVCQRVRDLQKRESLLEVACNSAGAKVATFSEYTRRIAKRTSDITQKSDKTGENYVTVAAKSKNSELETETCRDVRLTCEAVGDFLHRTQDGSLSDKTSLERAQNQLWNKVEKTVASRHVGALVSALVTNTEHAAKNLREETLGVNITKDAQDLRFSYANKSGLQDLSSPPSVQKSVQQLLEASNLQHVMRWFKEQEHKNEEWKLTARLDDMMTEIHKHVHRLMGEHPRNVPLAKGYIDAQVQLAVERAAAPCLRTEADSLIDRIQAAKAERQELRVKYEQIQDFKAVVEKKQVVIGTLAKQNSKAPNRLDSRRKLVLSYITTRAMDSHVTEIRHLTDYLKDSLLSELEKFSSLFLPCLLTVALDSNTRVCMLDLSISPSIHSLARERFRTFTDVCLALEFPVYKSTDSLMKHLLEVHDNMQELRRIQQQREARVRMARTATNAADDINFYVDLCQRAEQHDRAQCDKLLPGLQKRIDGVTSSVAEVSNIKRQVTTWWEQPAQFTTPWVITEGMTFDQWMQRWRVAVTQVHKKMMEGKTPRKK